MFQLTTFGQEAVTAAMAGETEITFTDLKTSDGSELITVGGYKDFASIKQRVAPTSISYDQTRRTVIVSGVFSNENVAATYDIVAVGLYATCDGTYSRSTPTLFAYDVLSQSEPMPASSAGLTTRTYAFNTTIDNSIVANITVETGAYALAEDLSDLQDTVEENRLENGIVEATHSKQGDSHYLTVNNAAVNIKFVATKGFDFNDVFFLNNTAYTAMTQSGVPLTPGYFVQNSIVTAFVDHQNHILYFPDYERVGIDTNNTLSLTDYADSLPLGCFTVFYPSSNTADPERPENVHMIANIYKWSNSNAMIFVFTINSNTVTPYKFTQRDGTWTRKWVTP